LNPGEGIAVQSKNNGISRVLRIRIKKLYNVSFLADIPASPNSMASPAGVFIGDSQDNRD
jgi:hypothetical protein